MTQTNNQKKGFDTSHWWNVFNRLFVSWGLLLFLLIAPICWALLPFAYRHIKKTDALIEANPLFLVFARMSVSVFLSFVLVVVIATVMIAFRFIPSIRNWGNDCQRAIKGIGHVLCSRICWLVWLAVFYSAARIVEMVYILGYEPSQKLTTSSLTEIQKATSLSAIQDYGYFMGLILAVPLGFLTTFVWKFLKSHLGSDVGRAKRIGAYGLSGKATTLSSVTFGICVFFLTLTSGFLYICAKEPNHVWDDIFLMTLIACVVAILTRLAAGCKSMGKLIDESQGVPTFMAILLSSIGINFIMSFVTMLIAFCGSIIHLLWKQQKSIPETLSTISELFSLYKKSEGFGWALWVVVGFCASVIAPIAQLIGVSWHDKEKSKLSRYGVHGSDWLVICGGFEPLFVALLMYISVNYLGGVNALKLCWDHDSVMNSNLLMCMAVLTVFVIAIVKITEVWVEKNSVIRNALFRQARGSSVDPHNNESAEKLYGRAITLSLLKLYDKREELARQKVFVAPRNESPKIVSVLNKKLEEANIVNCKLPEDMNGKLLFIVNMVNGNDYFTTDDPFTADVLKAHEKYCEAKCSGVSSMSLKRFVKKYTKVLGDEWPDVKKYAQSLNESNGSYDKSNSMPFVLFAPDEKCARKYVEAWNELLDIISDSITNQKIVGQVNRMICDFKPESQD